jgi:glucokinase
MAFTYHDKAVIGIDVGGTGLKGAVVDRQGQALVREQRPTQRERGPTAVIADILAFAHDLACALPGAAGADRIVAAGVAVPGLVNEEAGIALVSANLEWRDVPLRSLLEERLGIPVAVGHDVRVASIAEGLLGAARGSENYLFLTLGTGVGAAVVLHGAPYAGAHGVGGEFGHMTIQPNGPLCGCGHRGCVEALASAAAVARRYCALAQTQEAVTARDVAERAIAGDMMAAQIWSEAVDALGLGIANYITLLDPERVVIGGGMADAGPALFQPLVARLAAEARFQPVPPVLPAALGNDAGYLGAALRAWLALDVPRADLTPYPPLH